LYNLEVKPPEKLALDLEIVVKSIKIKTAMGLAGNVVSTDSLY
jgi:hypothetical protein